MEAAAVKPEGYYVTAAQAAVRLNYSRSDAAPRQGDSAHLPAALAPPLKVAAAQKSFAQPWPMF